MPMKNLKKVIVIPARLDSSRLPGKPLRKILGIPLVEHIYRRCKLSSIKEIYIATPDIEIKHTVEEFGGKTIMTSPKHKRACDRIAEACNYIEADIIITVQGDEALIVPDMIDKAVNALVKDENAVCVNLATEATLEEANDPNEVKVVFSPEGYALYFSRVPIPTNLKKEGNIPFFKQICVIPMRKEFLLKYSKLSPTPLEISESIDMLRLLEHGYKIKIIKVNQHVKSVDTPNDLKIVENLMPKDPIYSLYANQKKKSLG